MMKVHEDGSRQAYNVAGNNFLQKTTDGTNPYTFDSGTCLCLLDGVE
jgi:hypothetical protein